jgi:hypothetical protein
MPRARPKDRGRTTARGAPIAQREVSQGSESGGSGGACRGPPVPPAPFGVPYPQVKWGVLPRSKREIPPPKKRTPANPSPAPSRGGWNRGGPNRGRQGRGRTVRAQQPRRQRPPDPGRLHGPLQLVGPVDPVQKLALMMAVMMLGMPPVNGYHAGMESGARGDGGRMEPRFYPSAQVERSVGTPAAEKGVEPAALHRAAHVEPGGSSVSQVLQQVQLGMESMSRMKEEIQEKRLEKQKAHQMIMERMWEAHRQEMKEMQRVFQLEMKERRGAPELKEEGTLSNRQPQARIRKHLGEAWKPGDDSPILARVEGANLPEDGGGTASSN